MKRAWPILTFALALTLVSNALQADSYTVIVKSTPNAFVPADISIVTGDIIVWAWISGAHTVTSDDYDVNDPLTFDSGIKVAPSRYRRMFNAAGDYPYYCILHGSPGGFGHAGIIRVSSRAWDDDDEDAPLPTPTKVKRR